MKTVLGLDLGTSSIGWAVVNQAVDPHEKSSIVRLGVRVNPLTVDEKGNFEQGKSITTTSDRTQKRSMRRNLQRYKQRRDHLIQSLKSYGWISDSTVLAEEGNASTFETYRLRAKSATEEISLEQFARVLLMLNKKRGYKSSRKVNNEDEGELIDGMAVAKALYDTGQTPGEYTYNILKSGKKYVPTYYRSDLQAEFNVIFDQQSQYYPAILNTELREKLQGRNKGTTEKMFYAIHQVKCAELKDRKTRAITLARWRVEALSKQLDIEQVVLVLSTINGEISNSSGYLGAISDHSKELYFKRLTVGQFLMQNLEKDPHYRVKNRVFYRQDYLNEFETIWECQKQFHPELTDERKAELRDIIIFYQRKLKSQKGLISFCELESKKIEVMVDGKKKLVTTGPRVCPKSSPLFQQFKIWSELNNLLLVSKKDASTTPLTLAQRETLAAELLYVKEMKAGAAIKHLGLSDKQYGLNYEKLDGNTTAFALMEACKKVLEWTGHDVDDFDKKKSGDKLEQVSSVFESLGFKYDFLSYPEEKKEEETKESTSAKEREEAKSDKDETDAMFRLWHLLYSYEGDNSVTGNDALIRHIHQLTAIPEEYASALVNAKLEQDYGSLSTKAIKRILPFMVKDGKKYSEACEMAGYRHSKQSLTKEENDQRVLVDALDILPKNSLRNPVVEKILNQMVHVVNECSRCYGPFDEIHIEMARELKQTKQQREKATASLRARTKETEEIKDILVKEFKIAQPSRNDIIRYRLYEELAPNGYKTLYSNTYIPKEKLFSRDFDIEHIIPQAKLFDDSFGNKTLESRSVNLKKGDMTARDFVLQEYGPAEFEAYEARVKTVYGKTNPRKQKQLLTAEKDIPSDFLNRDLSDSQYIAKEAKKMLLSIARTVVVTTGSITARLREDWQLVDVMKELNWDKYHALGLTETTVKPEGHVVRRITGWSKRNDHRHHAMDALTIAFTTISHVQLLNNLNARSGGDSMYGIMYKEMTADRKFRLPMPDFRAQAMAHLEGVLISIKAKNKVATPSKNRAKNGAKQITLTPRGQLHKETVYGKRQRYATALEKVGKNFDEAKIATVCRKDYREALLARLAAFGGDPAKAFTGKNSLEKNILWLDELHTHAVPLKVKTVVLESYFTIRKSIDHELKIDKVVDAGIRRILQARLDEYGGNAKEAFSNLEDNPIWLNEEKGISIKSVTIKGVNVATPLHEKVDKNGESVPVDYVQTSNNHHVAIFEDENGDYHEHIVSFFEAMACKNLGLPVIDKEYNKDKGWKFLFTMKQNEYFVVPDLEHGFNPQEINLMDEANFKLISPHLFRVQKFTVKDYFFRHHLETKIEDIKDLKNITWLRITNLNILKGFVKVRVNHIGKIVAVGEYD
ncbi:MAG: type II CRISPR RNA-guided endonuclease Cas9 [Bacteroidales bacterium]|nr:type II CRISPR RNA-guided endonuclease Cas9 [Bacteroidales bacterium]